MSQIISNKSEILFIYDIENANPNGDPLNENRPRFDNDTSTVLVSDVRLKRTIRDYWFEYKGYNGKNDKDIFIREIIDNDGNVYDAKTRAIDFKNDKDIVINKCIDIRVFGGVLPLKKDPITFTGPTQFQMGRSLNKTEILTEQGTGAFASKEGKAQKTFRTEYKVPYAIIGFNGIINDKAAKYSKMTEEDKELLLEGLWEGTKNLISRSKYGQTPLLLLTIDYNESFYIGNLRQKIKLITDKNEKEIRSVNEYKLDLSEIFNEIKSIKNKIKRIYIKKDDRLVILNNNQVLKIINNEINVNEI
ncbi:MAG TPA: type I-B CRISPR-associated protein Cas7/Csh2 [Ignavibacteria bacterium]